jgi:hypothetical protein
MSNETGEKTAGDLESEIEELRRRIATWQPMMKNTRPTEAANLRDQIADAEIRIQDLSEMKRQSSGSELNGEPLEGPYGPSLSAPSHGANHSGAAEQD